MCNNPTFYYSNALSDRKRQWNYLVHKVKFNIPRRLCISLARWFQRNGWLRQPWLSTCNVSDQRSPAHKILTKNFRRSQHNYWMDSCRFDSSLHYSSLPIVLYSKRKNKNGQETNCSSDQNAEETNCGPSITWGSEKLGQNQQRPWPWIYYAYQWAESGSSLRQNAWQLSQHFFF